MSSTVFFQTRASMAQPATTRTALPGTPRPAMPTPQATVLTTGHRAVVLAWDNVLFPTKWMSECVGLLSARKQALDETKRACVGNPFIVQALTAIEEQVIQLLAAATTKAHVYILADHTGANFDALCSTFFPRLKACLATAHGRVSIVSAPASSAAESVSARAAWKLSALQQICSSTMAPLADGRVAPFKVLAVTADELDARVAARVNEVVARMGCVQCLTLPAGSDNGRAAPLVDFHKQLQSVAAALTAQYQ